MQYGCKEVPNVRLVFIDKGTQVHTIDCDSITDYTEDWETEHENNAVRIYLGTIDKADIDFIEQHHYTEILVYRSLIMRNADTGEDELYFPPTLTFHNLNFEYSLAWQGEATQWMIRLGN